jgi:homocitrate synthase NifV
LHADGVLKDPGNYEGYDPSEVGLCRHLVVGKHSGGHGLQDRLEKLGIKVGRKCLNEFLSHVRYESQKKKRALSDQDLIQIYQLSFKMVS